MKNKIITLVVIIVVVGVLVAFGIYRSTEKPIKTIDELKESNGYPVSVGYLKVGDMQQTADLTGTVTQLNKQELTLKVKGKVEEVYFREGETIHAGQVIVKLEQDTYIDALRQAKMNLNQQKANLSSAIVDKTNTIVQSDANVKAAKHNLDAAEEQLKLTKKPYRSQEVLQQEHQVNTAEYNYEKAKKDAVRYKNLYEQGAVSLGDYEQMQLKADVNKKTYDSAKEQMSLVLEQGRKEEVRKAELSVETAKQNLRQAKSNALQIAMKEESIKMAKAAVDSAQAAVQTAQNDLDNTVVKAKFDGVMASRKVEPGQTVIAGESLGELVSVNDLYYLANVSEIDIVNVKIGKKVSVKFDSIPGKKYGATVKAIYPVADAATKSFNIRVVLDKANGEIKSGMFAKGKLETSMHKNVIIAPQSAVKTKNGYSTIYLIDNDKVKQIFVNIVSRYVEDIEISPLTKGQIKGNEKIAISGIDSLQDDTKIVVNNK